jgi:hypothetical protein
MFAVIFDVEQAGFLSRLAELRDKKKTNSRFALRANKKRQPPPGRRDNIAKN